MSQFNTPRDAVSAVRRALDLIVSNSVVGILDIKNERVVLVG
jgi:hypothetical protein